MTLPELNGDLKRLLEPLERTAIVLVARHDGDVYEAWESIRAMATDMDGNSTARAACELSEARGRTAGSSGKAGSPLLIRGKEGVLPPTYEKFSAAFASGRRKIAGAVARRARAAATLPPGKSVTLPRDRYPTAEEAVMSEPVVPPEAEVTTDGFADRIEGEARVESTRVLAELVRLRFDAHQVVRVLRALDLDVPEELADIVDDRRAQPGSAAEEVINAQREARERAELQARQTQERAILLERQLAEEKELAGKLLEESDADLKAAHRRLEELERELEAARAGAEAPSAASTGTERPPAAPDTPGPDAQREKRATGGGAGTFLIQPAPDDIRTEEQVVARLRKDVPGEVTSAAITAAWKWASRTTADRIIRMLVARGLLVPVALPEGTTEVRYGWADSATDVRETLKVASGIDWRDLAVYRDAKNKTMSAELVARSQAACLAVIQESGNLTAGEVAKEAGIPQSRAGDYVRALKGADLIVIVERRRSRWQTQGRYSDAFGPKTPVRREGERELEKPVEPAAEASPEELLKVRDWVCQQPDGEPFSPGQVAEATGLSREAVAACLAELGKHQIVSDESPTADMQLYAYRKPTEAGRAAELDAERREPEPNGNGNGGGGAVAGTGRALRVSHKPTQQFLDRCSGKGAQLERVGNGHIAIVNPANGKRVIISSTPASGGQSKNEKKVRAIGLAI